MAFQKQTSNLFCSSVHYGRKKYYNIGTWASFNYWDSVVGIWSPSSVFIYLNFEGKRHTPAMDKLKQMGQNTAT
jgi:hypothetical protein